MRVELYLASRTSAGAGLAQTAQALDQHRRGLKGFLAIDEVIENLIIPRGA